VVDKVGGPAVHLAAEDPLHQIVLRRPLERNNMVQRPRAAPLELDVWDLGLRRVGRKVVQGKPPRRPHVRHKQVHDYPVGTSSPAL
jgi:hypothetical protein